jgi:CelD/BcsL family acetyltransferase involved in cellulose biosynthesis
LIDRWPPSCDVVEAWRALAVERGNIFISPEWYGTWLAMHPEERPLTLVCLDEHERVVGVLPLVMSRRGPVRILRFAAAHIGDWFGPACRHEDESTVAASCAATLQSLPGWHVLELHRLERDCGWAERLAAAWPERAMRVTPWRRGDVLPYAEIGAAGFDGYLASRSGNFRNQLGRHRRRLAGRHSVRLRMTRDERHLECDVSALFRLHHARWQSKGGSSLRGDGERFHREFAPLALARGWLRLWTLDLDGVPAAAWYGWRMGPRYCYSLSGFDPAHNEDKLGFLLMAHTIERAAEEGSAVYDMLWGDEAYKRRFETGRRWADSTMLTRRGHPASALVSTLAWATHRARRLPKPLRRRLKNGYTGARRQLYEHGARTRAAPEPRDAH